MEIDTNKLLESLKGWLRPDQLENIREAISEGKIKPEVYYSLSEVYVQEQSDNGGFTPREQYVLQFANKWITN